MLITFWNRVYVNELQYVSISFAFPLKWFSFHWWYKKMCWLYLTHPYVAAQRHRCGDRGEVNTLDLADCWTVIGLNEGWSNWAELDYKKISIDYMTVTRIHPIKPAYLVKFLTLYEAMALICDTMAIWTWSHGTPTSLGIKRVKYIIVYHSICIFDLLLCTSFFIMSCLELDWLKEQI